MDESSGQVVAEDRNLQNKQRDEEAAEDNSNQAAIEIQSSGGVNQQT